MARRTKRALVAGLVAGISLFFVGVTFGQQRGEAKALPPLLTCDELKIVLESGNPVVALDMVEKYGRYSCSDPKTTYHCIECLEGNGTALYTLGIRYFGKPFLFDGTERCKCFQAQ